MTALFVTGTGTDVGKTWLAAALLRRLRRRGTPARALKPVASGYDPSRPDASDAGVLLTAMGEAVDGRSVAAISPWRFAAPLSPDMAARRESRSLEARDVVAFCRAEMARSAGPLLIEGVGGALSPIAMDATCADLARELRCPALVVAGSYLGAISHALTALESLARRDVPVAALVVNETADGVVLAETLEAIRRFAPTTSLHAIARAGGAEATLDAIIEARWPRWMSHGGRCPRAFACAARRLEPRVRACQKIARVKESGTCARGTTT